MTTLHRTKKGLNTSYSFCLQFATHRTYITRKGGASLSLDRSDSDHLPHTSIVVSRHYATIFLRNIRLHADSTSASSQIWTIYSTHYQHTQRESVNTHNSTSPYLHQPPQSKHNDQQIPLQAQRANNGSNIGSSSRNDQQSDRLVGRICRGSWRSRADSHRNHCQIVDRAEAEQQH